jgi:hypothetical protein
MSVLRLKKFTRLALSAVACVLALNIPAACASDAAPDWFREIAKTPTGSYPEEVSAVVLLDDQTLTVQANGDMYLTDRRVAKILRPSGRRRYGSLAAYFDSETKLEYMRGWSISPNGKEFAVKDKDAIETSPYDEALYQDTRYKVMELPGVDVGSYVAFEYRQRIRPHAYSNRWDFQERVPVKVARFSINLPSDWEYQYHFANWTEKKPVNGGGNNWTWEIDDIPGITHEPEMPAVRSLSGMMAIDFYSASLGSKGRLDTWSDVARWADLLNANRRVATPAMQTRVAELTTGKMDAASKMRALSDYVQRNIRYVEIAIGIGGFQSHMAGDTFANSYGDCKDKATLLITMLREAGIDAYLTLVDSERGVVNPAAPTPFTFDHAIVAIKLPPNTDSTGLYATVDHPKLGKLLFFDPTNEMVPLGRIPGYEQNSYALVVTSNGGELLKMPTLEPNLNRLFRIAHLQLAPNGSLTGEVEETRIGEEAVATRRLLARADREKRMKYFESMLAEFLDRSKLTYASITGLDQYDQPLVIRYKFEAPEYAKSAGDLMLVRPRVLGERASSIGAEKKRKYPISYDSTSVQSDAIEIKLPAGYKVDELPGSAQVDTPFAEYKSKIETRDDILYYNRTYTIKDLTVGVDQMGTLRTFMQGVAADERNTAVLKKSP